MSLPFQARSQGPLPHHAPWTVLHPFLPPSFSVWLSSVSLVNTESASCLEPMTRFAAITDKRKGGRGLHRKLLPCLPPPSPRCTTTRNRETDWKGYLPPLFLPGRFPIFLGPCHFPPLRVPVGRFWAGTSSLSPEPSSYTADSQPLAQATLCSVAKAAAGPWFPLSSQCHGQAILHKVNGIPLPLELEVKYIEHPLHHFYLTGPFCGFYLFPSP
ncbi:hypothetical protein V8F20_004324 [Naviculisporaceae sp. PSN 640]